MARRVNPVPADSASIERGAKLYAEKCSLCHGEKGRGDGPAAQSLRTRPTDLATMSGMHPDGDVAWKIAEGRGAMPGWKGRLSEAQIWDLVNFIRNLGTSAGTDPKSDMPH
ncbi:MAG: hypothetical protein Kow0089_07410 [Desulfobulbaceae bacterium]